jgi:hydroxymethylpyrimidine pyrophosphatase-like HAD family hydrolase
VQPIVFLDLDDTLFSTRRKDPSASIAVAYDRQDQPRSFMSGRQQAFLEWLARDALLVPTTGRNRDAFRRVRLPLDGYAICSFGGLILTPAGEPEPRWHARMETAAAGCHIQLTRLTERVLELSDERGLDVRARVICDADLPFYVSAKHNQEDAAELEALSAAVLPLLPPGWQLHLNDNNLSIMPPFLGKEHAVAWFLREIATEGAFAVGVGDSLSDAPFMALCDFALTPSRSQLFSLLAARAAR